MDTPKLNALVEETCMNAWPALKEVFYDGWLIRLANGATRRTNSVNVIGEGQRALADKIAYCEAVYRAHAQPTYFRILSTSTPDLDDALATRGYAREDETRTLFMDFGRRRPRKTATDAAVEIRDGRPSPQWLAAYQRHSRCSDAEAQGRRDVLNMISVPAFFAEARDDTGEAPLSYCDTIAPEAADQQHRQIEQRQFCRSCDPEWSCDTELSEHPGPGVPRSLPA